MDTSSQSEIRCAVCGELHPAEEIEVTFTSPDAYTEIPDKDRESRARLNSDFCQIDWEHYFVRCLVPVPVIGQEDSYCWGAWAKVSKDDFQSIIDSWDDEDLASMPIIHGNLANEVPEYPGSKGLKVTLTLFSDSRPLIQIPGSSQFAIDQRTGVTSEAMLGYYHYVT